MAAAAVSNYSKYDNNTIAEPTAHFSKQQQQASSQHHPSKKQFGEVILELREITKSYPIDDGADIVHALKNVSISDELHALDRGFPSIRQGEFIMIRGPSGGGKTTLLNIIGTIDLPTAGVLKLLGSEITKDSEDDFLSLLRLRHIGFVFQTFNLLSTMTALENVELPMTLLGELSEKERRSRAKKLLALVGLRNRIHHLPSELSGGEQQRVTIARALANNPSILLLDEATGDLDTATTIEVMNLLAQINHLSGVTCIMVTHNPDIECYADRILYVEDGRFNRQVLNAQPVPLVREEYENYLKQMDNTALSNIVEYDKDQTQLQQSVSTQPIQHHQHNNKHHKSENNSNRSSNEGESTFSNKHHTTTTSSNRNSNHTETSNTPTPPVPHTTKGDANDDDYDPRQKFESLFVRPPPPLDPPAEEKIGGESSETVKKRTESTDFELPPVRPPPGSSQSAKREETPKKASVGLGDL